MNQADVSKEISGKIREVGVFDAIYIRRAVRHYTSQKVSRPELTLLLNAAVQAPSAMNSQPWGFVVIQDPALLKKISDGSKQMLLSDPKWHPRSGHAEHGFAPMSDPDFNIFYNASTLVIICAEKKGFGPIGDCYIAGQNFMLAAKGLGLDTCPIGFARDFLQTERMKTELKIPAEFTPVLPIILGYSSQESARAARVERRPPRILSSFVSPT
jgi:nitroreductase